MCVYDPTLLHLRTPTDRYYVVLVNIKVTSNIYTQTGTAIQCPGVD